MAANQSLWFNVLSMPFLREVDIQSPAPTAIKDRPPAELAGKTIIHINSTDQGGGVAEMLKSQVPLERDRGFDSRWFVMEDVPSIFFEVTKKIHNLLQGARGSLTSTEQVIYLKTNEHLIFSLASIIRKLKGGVVLIHDPQPLPLIDFIPFNFASILRLHIDLSDPNKETADFLKPFIYRYQHVVVSNLAYADFLPGLSKSICAIAPAIDPLAEKNKDIGRKYANYVLSMHGIDPSRLIMAQVARFDCWKDQISTIRAYKRLRRRFKNLQLILAGIMTAKDDPEALAVLTEIIKQTKDDTNIFVFSKPSQIRHVSEDIFINAINSGANVIMHKSTREGFGMAVTEAMWKERVVIAGRTPGTEMQIKDTLNGFIVSDWKQAAAQADRIFSDKSLALALGKNAKHSVSERYLISRLIDDHRNLYFNCVRDQSRRMEVAAKVGLAAP